MILRKANQYKNPTRVPTAATRRIRFQTAAALERSVIVRFRGPKRRCRALSEFEARWQRYRPLAPKAFLIAPEMVVANIFIFSSDSASIMTRATGSVPE